MTKATNDIADTIAETTAKPHPAPRDLFLTFGT